MPPTMSGCQYLWLEFVITNFAFELHYELSNFGLGRTGSRHKKNPSAYMSRTVIDYIHIHQAQTYITAKYLTDITIGYFQKGQSSMTING
jgi:hypothetical protein